jgi:glycosyltransferase involved in cell wall biosynthesis
VVYEYANRLQERGHEVSIVYPLIPPFPADLIRQNGLINSISKFFKLPNLLKEKNWEINAKLIKVPTLSPKLKWMYERKVPNADVIIATDFSTAYPVAKLGEEKGEKFHFVQGYEIIQCLNDERFWERLREIEEDPRKFYIAMAEVDAKDLPSYNIKKLVDDALTLPLKKITISTWLKELLENKFGQKVEDVIINGCNFKLFYNEIKTWNEKKRILAPYQNQTARFKGAEDSIKAFKIVRERFPDVQFVMFDLTRGDVPEWIELHVNPSDKELRELYSSCDIFISSNWMGLDLPCMEAMACKCAVIATDSGGTSDCVIPGETALVSPPRDPDSLAKNIILLIENGEKLKELSELGHKFIKRFTWERAIDKFENVLKTYYKKDG